MDIPFTSLIEIASIIVEAFVVSDSLLLLYYHQIQHLLSQYTSLWLSDDRFLEGDRRLREDTTLQRGTTTKCNGRLCQYDALHM